MLDSQAHAWAKVSEIIEDLELLTLIFKVPNLNLICALHTSWKMTFCPFSAIQYSLLLSEQESVPLVTESSRSGNRRGLDPEETSTCCVSLNTNEYLLIPPWGRSTQISNEIHRKKLEEHKLLDLFKHIKKWITNKVKQRLNPVT